MSEIIIEPFLTYYRDNPDYNASDAKNEFDLMMLRNGAIEDWIDGNQSSDYVFDVLRSQGIDPDAYLKSIESEIEYFIANPDKLYC